MLSQLLGAPSGLGEIDDDEDDDDEDEEDSDEEEDEEDNDVRLASRKGKVEITEIKVRDRLFNCSCSRKLMGSTRASVINIPLQCAAGNRKEWVCAAESGVAEQ